MAGVPALSLGFERAVRCGSDTDELGILDQCLGAVDSAGREAGGVGGVDSGVVEGDVGVVCGAFGCWVRVLDAGVD